MLRVLVVDDCTDTTTSFSILMGLWGHDVRAANDGEAALELAASYRPDVVFLDLAMPGLDGCETARRLRTLPGGTGPTRLVALSGLTGEEDRCRAREAGIDLHLFKPIGPDDLEQVLASCAGAHQG